MPQDEQNPRRYLILAICCASLLIVGMDATIVNVALPSISHDLHAPVSGLQWVLDAYTVTLASLLLLSGSTADRLGRRAVFQTGLVVFSIGSLLCGVAHTLTLLIVFRVVQAIGGSMLNPVAMSIITTVFTDRRERARAIGIWGAVVGLSLGIGPVLGGILTETVGWRAVFVINVPIGVAAIVLAALFVPESRSDHPRRLDPVGQVLIIALLAGLTYTIIESPRAGLGSAETITALVVAVLAAAVLVPYENRRRQPLLDPHFFNSAPFSGATLAAVLAFGGFGSFLFLNTLYLQQVRGLSPLQAGLLTLPLAVTTLVLAPVSGRMVARFGPRPSLLAASGAMALGTLGLTTMAPGTSYGLLIACYLAFGAGFGFVNAPITNTAVSGMPLAQAGVAAAVASTSRQVGTSLGVAVTGALIGTLTVGDHGAEITAAAPAVWWIVFGGSLALGVIGLVSTGSWAAGTAERTARRFDEPAAERPHTRSTAGEPVSR